MTQFVKSDVTICTLTTKVSKEYLRVGSKWLKSYDYIYMCGLVYTNRNVSPRKGGYTNSEIDVCAIQSKPIEIIFVLVFVKWIPMWCLPWEPYWGCKRTKLKARIRTRLIVGAIKNAMKDVLMDAIWNAITDAFKDSFVFIRLVVKYSLSYHNMLCSMQDINKFIVINYSIFCFLRITCFSEVAGSSSLGDLVI